MADTNAMGGAAFEQLARRVPDPADRVFAIRAAWMGYMRRGFRIVGLLGLLAALAPLIGLGIASESATANLLPETMQARKDIAVVLYLAAPLLAMAAVGLLVSNRRWNRRAEALQTVGLTVLEAHYDEIAIAGAERIEREMRQLVGEAELRWHLVEHWPHNLESNGVDVHSGRFAAPRFSQPAQFECNGLFQTPESLIVIPPAVADLSDRTPDAPVALFDIYGTFAQLARRAPAQAEGEYRGMAALPVAELYFAEMVNAEYAGSGGEIAVLSITTRDGRTFAIRARPEAADKIRGAIRGSKRIPTQLPA